MLNPTGLIAFVATCDPSRARDFYQNTLGLTLRADEPHALVFDAHGSLLLISKVSHFTPAAHTVLGWQVADILAEVTELTGRGVLFERFAGFAQDELGIYVFPNGNKVAWFKDPDGNLLSLSQFD